MAVSLAQAAANLSVGLLLGAAIGLERQWRQRLAGLRTNALVALGAAIFILYGRIVSDDAAARMAPQVVSGIGFLGAGVIFKEGLNVRGLNTAATLWCSAAVGLLAGEGYAVYAGVAAALVLGANLALRPLVQAINRQPVDSTEGETHYLVAIECRASVAAEVRDALAADFAKVPDAQLHEVSATYNQDADRAEITATLVSHRRREIAMESIVARLAKMPGVTRADWRVNALAT